MPDYLTEPGDTFVAIIRQIAREEIRAALVQHDLVPAEQFDRLFPSLRQRELSLSPPFGDDPVVPEVCGAKDPAPTGRICQKPVHRGRHLYTALPHVAPDNGWRDIEWFGLNSGSRHYVIKIGHPVKVKGFGRGGAAQPGWFVTSIQQRGDDINVGVRKDRTGPERTVKADKIVYMRPKKVT